MENQLHLKVIAIGNIIMGDDGIAIKILDSIKHSFKNRKVEFVIGETDVDYCLSKICSKDFLIILDAINSGKEPGTITCIPLNEMKNKVPFSQHQLSLFEMLELTHINNEGFFVGIEISKIHFTTELSIDIKNKFQSICHDIINIINESLESLKY